MKTIVLLILLTQVGCTFMIHAAGSMVGNVLGDVVLEEMKKEKTEDKKDIGK